MSQVQNCIKVIRKSAKDFKPQVGLILGSGLGQFCEHVNVVASIDFKDLPGFPIAGVGGHAGKLLLGQVSGTVLQFCKVEHTIMKKARPIQWLWLFKPLMQWLVNL